MYKVVHLVLQQGSRGINLRVVLGQAALLPPGERLLSKQAARLKTLQPFLKMCRAGAVLACCVAVSEFDHFKEFNRNKTYNETRPWNVTERFLKLSALLLGTATSGRRARAPGVPRHGQRGLFAKSRDRPRSPSPRPGAPPGPLWARPAL